MGGGLWGGEGGWVGGGRGGEVYEVVTGSLAIQPKGNLGCGSMEIVGRAGGEVCRAGWVG